MSVPSGNGSLDLAKWDLDRKGPWACLSSCVDMGVALVVYGQAGERDRLSSTQHRVPRGQYSAGARGEKRACSFQRANGEAHLLHAIGRLRTARNGWQTFHNLEKK